MTRGVCRSGHFILHKHFIGQDPVWAQHHGSTALSSGATHMVQHPTHVMWGMQKTTYNSCFLFLHPTRYGQELRKVPQSWNSGCVIFFGRQCCRELVPCNFITLSNPLAGSIFPLQRLNTVALVQDPNLSGPRPKWIHACTVLHMVK